MSKRLNLREFQQTLNDRMQDKYRSGSQSSSLGVQIAGQNWLVDMVDIGEVLAPPPLTPVPLSKAWLLGVANVRGNLYCVTDMAAYQHKGKATGSAANRLLLVAERHAFNAALLVDRVLGLRDARGWRQSEADGPDGYRDEHGALWRKLDVPGLLEQAEFLQIGG
ncbi:MAG: chemotaxis protein CheW [Nitrosomonadales bacterium]|nr:chemotaxis protein CheW [Nitrosomonadales bacterium]